MPNPDEVRRLNGPMLDRLRKCAADTSPNWDGKITIYPPEARQLVAFIDAVLSEPSEGDTDPQVVLHLEECDPGDHPGWTTAQYRDALAEGGALCDQTQYMTDELFPDETVWVERRDAGGEES